MIYDAIEVQGCIELGDGVIEPCHGKDKPTMYCVFAHRKGGGVDWMSDHGTRGSAIQSATATANMLDIKLYDYTKGGRR